MVIGIGVVAAAIIVLLLLLAAEYLGKALGHVVSGIPLVGGHLADALESMGESISNWVSQEWDSVVAHLATVINTPVAAIKAMIADINAAVAEAETTAEWLVTSYIPRTGGAVASQALAVAEHTADRLTADLAAIADRAESNLATAEAYAASQAGQVADRLNADLAAIADRAAANLTTAEAYTVSTVGQLADRLNADLAAIADRAAANLTTAEAYADARAHTALAALASTAADLTRAIAAAETTAVTTAAGALTTDIEHAVAGTAATVTGAVDGAIDAAAGGFADIVDAIKGIDWANVTDMAGVVAATGAIATTLNRYLRECGMPNCRNLGGFGSLLNSLLGLIEDGALIALLVEMIHDPAGGAADIRGVMGGMATDAVNAAQSLLNI